MARFPGLRRLTARLHCSTYTSVNGRVYLPDLRNNSWVSDLHVRNNAVETRAVTIYYFGVNGNPMPHASDTCTLNSNQRCFIPIDTGFPYNTRGSAYVDGSEDVSIVATQVEAGPTNAWDGYSGIHQATSTAQLPLLQKNNSGIYSVVDTQPGHG